MKIFLDSSYLIYLRYAESDTVFNYVIKFLLEAVKQEKRLMVNMIVIDETVWILSTLRKKTPSEREGMNCG